MKPEVVDIALRLCFHSFGFYAPFCAQRQKYGFMVEDFVTLSRVGTTSILLVVTVALYPASAQYVPDAGKVGLPMNGVFSGGSIDSVQVNNGNLHIDIPLLHLPGVGMDADFHYIYDNQVFTQTDVPYYWSPANTSQTPDEYWHVITMSRYMSSVNDPLSAYLKIGKHTEHWECGNPLPVWSGDVTNFDFVSFSDINGTAHAFPVDGYVPGQIEPCTPATMISLNTFSIDAEGYNLTLDSSGAAVVLTDKHGRKYDFGTGGVGGSVPVYSMNPNIPENPVYAPTVMYYYPLSKIEDSNGNMISSNSTGIVDTLGRQITETQGGGWNSDLTVEALGNSLTSISYLDQTNIPETIVIHYAPVTIDLTQACNQQGGPSLNCGPKPYVAASTITVQLPDYIQLQNGDQYHFTYFQGQLGELQQITLPTGGTINYTYSDVGGLDGMIGRSVKSRTVTANGQSSTWTFNNMVVTDPAGNDTKYTCGLGWPCYMTQEVMYNGSYNSGTPLATRSTTYTQYGCALLPTAEIFTWNESGQTTETDKTYDSISGTSDTVCSNLRNAPYSMYPTTTGRANLKSAIVYDYGTTAGTHGALISNTQYSYLHESNSAYANANIADRVTQVSVYNSSTISSSTLVAQTTTAYDNFSNGGQSSLSTNIWTSAAHDSSYGTGATLRGLPTGIAKYVGPSSTVANYTNYNILGQPTVETDGRGNSTHIVYSTGSPSAGGADYVVITTLPSTTTNGTTVTHSTKLFQDPNTSLVMAKADQNNNQTSYTYDPRMRLLCENRPDGGSTCNSYTTNEIIATTKEDQARSTTTTTILDGVGRKITSSATSDAVCGPLTVDTTYDLMNRVQSVSNPHCNDAGITDGVTSYIYDAIGRLTNKVNPDGTQQRWSFSGSAVTFFDENSYEWQHKYDAMARLAKVMEPAGTTATNVAPTLETDYTYDAIGNLLRVDQWGGAIGTAGDHVRKFAYDGLSRLIAASNPESAGSAGPALTCTGVSGGPWTNCYTYDNNGT